MAHRALGSFNERMTTFRTVVLAVTALTMGLMAGLFFSYANSVMPALRRSDDKTFVTAMHHINIVIQNGAFLLCFMGALLLGILAAAVHLTSGTRRILPWVLAALVLYAAVFLVTMAFNIPLNNKLDAAGDPDKITNFKAVRDAFEVSWIRWNLVRTVGAVAAFMSITWALVLSRR
jgi:uncharacterized membrane protein